MIIPILGLGLIFIIIGLWVNKRNAADVLSGYAHLSRQEKEKLDMTRVAVYFRRFHLFLGISTIIIGLSIHAVWGPSASIPFLVLFPLAAYLFYFSHSMFRQEGKPSRVALVSIIILIITTLFVLILFRAGHAENTMQFEPGQWVIRGMYGEKIRPADIEYLEVVDTLPAIRLKLNGFATGRVRKGIFQTQDRRRIKLLIDTHEGPYLLLHRKSGDDFYMAFRSKPADAVLQDITAHYPSIPIR